MLKELFAMVEMLKARALMEAEIGEIKTITIWEENGHDKVATIDTIDGFNYVLNLDGTNNGRMYDFTDLHDNCGTFVMYAEDHTDVIEMSSFMAKREFTNVTIYYVDTKYVDYFK